MRKLLKIICRHSKDYVNRKEVWYIPKEERQAAIFQIALHTVNYNRDMAIKLVNELCDQEEKDPGFWHNVKTEENVDHDIQCCKNKQ